MIKLMLNNILYSKSYLFSSLEGNNLSKDKVGELYKIYGNEKESIRVRKSDMIKREDIGKLINISEKLLENVKKELKWARKNIRKALKASSNK